MNYNLIQIISNRAPGVLSGISTFSQISSENADSVQSFNTSLSDWRQRAETMEQSAMNLADAGCLLELNAREVADMGFDLRAQQFELVRKLIAIHRQRAALVDVMATDLTTAQADAEKKHTAAVTLAEKQLSKILSRDNQREHAQFDMAVRQSDAVKSTQAAITDIRGHLSALTELRRPLDDNDVKLREMLVEAAKGLTGG